MITEVGQNIKQNLETEINHKVNGKCIAEGIVKPGSIKIISYSSGYVRNDRVEFQVVFECMICNPVGNMEIECTAKTITKAGIHAEVIDDDGTVPVTVFIARDHHYTNKSFANVTENEKISVSVIGSRFELNDPYICVIAKYIDKKQNELNNKTQKKPPLSILED
jgi:DNA-directed RNA polymerase subunit E'/Rpb7